MRWLVLLALAGCYQPHPAEGAPCTSDEQCPSPQRCLGGSCSLGDLPADAPPADAAIDAPVDAPPDAAALACVATGNVCGNGGLSIMSCANRCWVLCSAPRSHDAAVALCAAWQGTLAEIDDQVEQDCVEPKINANTWIGLAQPPGALVPQASWTWDGARAINFANWQRNVPDDADGLENGREQCGHIQPDGTWDDVSCDQQRPVLCERPSN